MTQARDCKELASMFPEINLIRYMKIHSIWDSEFGIASLAIIYAIFISQSTRYAMNMYHIFYHSYSTSQDPRLIKVTKFILEEHFAADHIDQYVSTHRVEQTQFYRKR